MDALILDPQYMFKFNLFENSLRHFVWIFIYNLGYPLLIFVTALEFTRQLYKNATDKQEMNPIGVLVKIAVFGVIFAVPRAYTGLFNLFISTPISAITDYIALRDQNAFSNILERATEALQKNSLSTWSLIKTVFSMSFGPIAAIVSFTIMFVLIYGFLIVQKILFALLFFIGPFCGPFIIFKPLSSLFNNWLKAVFAISFWSLFIAILIKILVIVGLDSFLLGMLAGESNPIRITVVSFAIILMTLSIVPLTSQLFGFSFISPLTPGRLFGLMGFAAISATQLAARGALKFTKASPILGKISQMAANKGKSLKAKKGPAQTGEGHTHDTIGKDPMEEFTPHDLTSGLKRKMSFRERLLKRGRSLSKISSKLANMAMINERTARIQGSLFKKLVTKFSLAKNPCSNAVNSIFFGGHHVMGSFGWIFSGGKGKYKLANELSTPRAFSNVKTREDYLNLTSQLRHFRHLSKNERLTILENLNFKGYKNHEISQSMEILDHNFKGYDKLDNMEGMIQKVIDLNDTKKFKNIINGYYHEAEGSDVWRYFTKDEVLKSIDKDNLKELLSAFSPGFILASAKYLRGHCVSFNKNNALRMLKSFMGKNKIYDKITPDENMGINRFVSFQSNVKSKRQAKKAIRSNPLFSKLTDGQLDNILQAGDFRNASIIAEFSQVSMADEKIENPYKLLREIVRSTGELQDKMAGSRGLDEGMLEGDYYGKADMEFMDEDKYKQLSQKYSFHSILGAVNYVKALKSKNAPSAAAYTNPIESGQVFTKNESKEHKKEFARQYSKIGGLNKPNLERSMKVMSMISQHDIPTQEIIPEYVNTIYYEDMCSSGEGMEDTVFHPDQSFNYRNEFIDKFVESGGIEDVSTAESVQMIKTAVNNDIHVGNISNKTIKEILIPGVRHQNKGTVPETVFKENDSNEYKKEFIKAFSSAGGFNGASSERCVKMMEIARSNDVSINEITPEYINETLKPEALKSLNMMSPDDTKYNELTINTVFQEDDSTEFKDAFISNFAVNGGFDEVNISEAIDTMSSVRETIKRPEEITPDLIQEAKTADRPEDPKNENFQDTLNYLYENYRTKPEYHADENDFYQYVEYNSEIKPDSFGSFSKVFETTPKEALSITKEINKEICLSEFSADELKNAVNDIGNGNKSIDDIAKEKIKPLSPDESVRIIRSIPAFKTVENDIIKDFLVNHETSDLIRYAKKFSDEIEGIEGINIKDDFNLFINEIKGEAQ